MHTQVNYPPESQGVKMYFYLFVKISTAETPQNVLYQCFNFEKYYFYEMRLCYDFGFILLLKLYSLKIVIVIRIVKYYSTIVISLYYNLNIYKKITVKFK